MNKRNTKKEKMKENKGYPYKSRINNQGLYFCRFCNEKVDFDHECHKKDANLWKPPQSKRSKVLQELNKQNRISK
jgi:hypothetical protein